MSVIGNIKQETMLGIQIVNRNPQGIIPGIQTVVVGNAPNMISYNTDPYGTWDTATYTYTCGKDAYYRLTYKINAQVASLQQLDVYVNDGTNKHLWQTYNNVNPLQETYCFTGSEVVFITSGTVLRVEVDSSLGGGLLIGSSPTQDGNFLQIVYEGV